MKKVATGAGFARYELGDLSVIALRDGYVDMPASRLRREGDRPFGDDLPAQVKLVDGKLRLSVNSFLVIDHDQYILIDTGAADAWEPTMGALFGSLDEAGIRREQITTVALTHTHLDHVAGLVAPDGTDAFPKLDRLLVPQEEMAMFDANERLSRFRQRRLPLSGGFQVSSNVTAVQAHGHEVGHTAFAVSGGGDTLLIWGDIVHVPSIQFERPELTWEFDNNQREARSTREVMLRRAVQPNVFVAGAHLDFPGVGEVTEADGAYSYKLL